MNQYINVLVTGSSGQLGTELYNLVKNKLNTNDQQKFIFLNRNELDITNKEDTQKFIKDKHIKIVINCAAYTNVELAEEQVEQCFLVNSSGVDNLVSGLESVEGSLIHISTDYVFNGESKVPYAEDAPTNPINAYGISKLQGEDIIRSSSIPFIIIRTSWLYSQYGNNFMKLVLNKLDLEEELNIIGDQIGSPTNAFDLASYILKSIKKLSNSVQPIRELIHFSNSGHTSWFNFANEIKNLSGSKVKINKVKVSDMNFKAQRPKYSVLDNSKAKKFLSYNDRDWRHSLLNCYKSYSGSEK
jgi:dTDP-4-dehydrorhamnose reductase